jgi:hypothetical protein
MSLSAIDSIDRGVANLRANWELVLLQLGQVLVCSVLAVVGVIAVALGVGASFLLQLGDLSDWPAALERLRGLTVSGAVVALALGVAFILVTIVGLVYSWFQAGILATLDRGERQAPPVRKLDWRLFRTFQGRSFAGWAGEGAWRYLGFFCALFVLAMILVGGCGLVIALLAPTAAGFGIEGVGVGVAGCLTLLPLLGLCVLLNLFALLAMVLLARPDGSVWRAMRQALGVLRRRLGGLLLLALLFVIAVFGVALVFAPLSQGMATAVPTDGAAWFAVQFLLALAQWIIQGILTIALLASTVAMVRGEMDGRAGAR